jgi:asparagine synthase (glutamine-hydrolysing)
MLSDESLSSFGIFNPEKVKTLISKIENGGIISEIDQMAITGILSTQIIFNIFLKNPIYANVDRLNNYSLVKDS